MDIPSYVKLKDQEIFFEELVQTLQQGVGNNGFSIPALTTAQINAIAPTLSPGFQWFNTSLGKMQILINPTGPVIETITSV